MLRKHDKSNFGWLLTAAPRQELALVETRDQRGRYVALVCAMQNNPDGTITPVPYAEMIRGNPFELYADPTADTLPEEVKIEEMG